MNLRRLAVAGLVAVAVMLSPTSTTATAPAGVSPIPGRTPHTVSPTAIGDTLMALDRLHSYGYSINTPARAARAIRHWQQANRLTVDGLVGPETLASLGLVGHVGSEGATVTAPAVRDTLPPEPTVGTPATVEEIIRAVWPDDLEDRAVAIAWRESRFVPTARNACCWGLFQINWGAHRGWLGSIGVTTAGQLLDPWVNATAAFALYQRDGWRPWQL